METAKERVGWEMVLPLNVRIHEGSRVHRCTDVYKQKVEHGRAIYCNTNASRPLQGGDATRRGKGDNDVVGPEGDRLGESQSKGSGYGIRVGTGERHGRGGDAGRGQQGKRLKWGRMEWSKCRRVGSNGKLVNILHKDRVW